MSCNVTIINVVLQKSKKEKKAKKERNGQSSECLDQTEDVQTPSESSNVQTNGHTEKELTPEERDGALSKFDISEDTTKKLTGKISC